MDSSAQIAGWIARLRAGEPGARDQLVAAACDRLTRLTRKMLRDFPRVRRWEETADVLQNATLRLCRSLEEVRPESVRDFFRLAATNIRRELIDLARHHFGPHGEAGHHHSHGTNPGPDGSPSDGSHRPDKLAAWAEFHRQAGDLPEEEREAFDLLWYQELSQKEAAELLGVSERTVKRRWQSARLMLAKALPEGG